MENRVMCAECARELMPEPPKRDKRLPMNAMDSEMIAFVIAWLQAWTFTPMQAEHLMVILRSQTRS